MLISRLEQQLDAHNETHRSRGYRLALSVGISRFEPDSTLTIDQLLDHADRELYQQRRERRR
jgi:GGDEF domain-containing protein